MENDCRVCPVYRIVRFYRAAGKKTRTIRTGLTLEEAQAHCRRDETQGEDWFDGYDYMPGFSPREKATE